MNGDKKVSPGQNQNQELEGGKGLHSGVRTGGTCLRRGTPGPTNDTREDV